jgi:hypothetical protein
MSSPSLTFDVQDLDTPIALKRPGWDGFAAWLDSFLAGMTGDAQHNLVTGCAVTPGAAELAEIFADGYGFLPGELAGALLEAAGLPDGLAGLGAVYPLVSAARAEEVHRLIAGLTAILDMAPTGELSAETNAEIQRARDDIAALQSETVPRELIDAARKRTRRPFFALIPGGWWACKAPGTSEASAYEDAITAAVQGRGSRAEALRTLTLSCVLSPDPEVAKAQIEETPAIPYLLARALRSAAGEGKAVARVSS